MTTDTDRRAITRKRRQEGRCVACGARCGCQVLCDICKSDLMYCPDCESTYSRRRDQRTSRPCLACRRKQRCDVPADQIAMLKHRRYQARLNRIVKHYRNGMPVKQIAQTVGSPVYALKTFIQRARASGAWPKDLYRKRVIHAS